MVGQAGVEPTRTSRPLSYSQVHFLLCVYPYFWRSGDLHPYSLLPAHSHIFLASSASTDVLALLLDGWLTDSPHE